MWSSRPPHQRMKQKPKQKGLLPHCPPCSCFETVPSTVISIPYLVFIKKYSFLCLHFFIPCSFLDLRGGFSCIIFLVCGPPAERRGLELAGGLLQGEVEKLVAEQLRLKACVEPFTGTPCAKLSASLLALGPLGFSLCFTITSALRHSPAAP